MNTREDLVVRILHKLSEKFTDRLVLKGGVLLQMMRSPRSTQDLDYALISKESKKILSKSIEESLLTLEDIRLEEPRLNSRGIFMDIQRKSDPSQKVLLEISVVPALNIKTLKDRFEKLSIHREKPKPISFQQGAELLKERMNTLTESEIETELYPLLPPHQRSGLFNIIRVTAGRLSQRIAAVGQL